MKINVKATNTFLTNAISDYLNKKIGHLEKFINPEHLEGAMCYVEIGKTTSHHKAGDIFMAEINLHIGGNSLRAVCEKDDLYSAIDAVQDDMARELKSFKEKRKGLIKRGGAKIKEIIKGLYN